MIVRTRYSVLEHIVIVYVDIVVLIWLLTTTNFNWIIGQFVTVCGGNLSETRQSCLKCTEVHQEAKDPSVTLEVIPRWQRYKVDYDSATRAFLLNKRFLCLGNVLIKRSKTMNAIPCEFEMIQILSWKQYGCRVTIEDTCWKATSACILNILQLNSAHFMARPSDFSRHNKKTSSFETTCGLNPSSGG